MGEAAAGPSFRTIEEAAQRAGAFCWIDQRLFEITGSWASAQGDPEVRVYFSESSARHAQCAAEWGDRLPVRAGVDSAALVAPPASGSVQKALEILEAEPELLLELGGLVRVVLPRLLVAYAHHQASVSPVSEAPTAALLRQITPGATEELRRGEHLLQRRLQQPEQAEIVAEFCLDLERPFGDTPGVFPDVRAS
jgi:hypothetical protein